MHRNKIIIFAFAAALCSFPACVHTREPAASGPESAPGKKEYPAMHVKGRHLYTAWNEKIVLRGLNHLFIWVDKDGDPSLAEMARTGANAARLVWLTKGDPDEMDELIRNCIMQKMIPMIELHDATGKWNELGACVDYWVRPDIVAILKRHEKYLLVNIANEAGDGSVTAAQFTAGYTDAIARIRRAGVAAPLVIDASDWGKDWKVLKAAAPALTAADPLHNVMFSIHMWWPAMWNYSADSVRQTIKEAVALDIPLIVGEFGNRWDETDQGKIPYLTIIEECEKHGIGWLAWSWGPGNRPQTWLDMTADGRFDTLSGWGREVALTDPHSIRHASKKPASLERIVDSGLIPGPLREE